MVKEAPTQEKPAIQTPDQKAFADLVEKIKAYQQKHLTDSAVMGFSGLLVTVLREMIASPGPKKLVLLRETDRGNTFHLGFHYMVSGREFHTKETSEFVGELTKWLGVSTTAQTNRHEDRDTGFVLTRGTQFQDIVVRKRYIRKKNCLVISLEKNI